MHAPFFFGDNDHELRSLLTEGRFGEETIQPEVGTVRFPTSEDLVRHYVGGSPLAAHVARLADGARSQFINEVGRALRPYVNDQELVFPIEGHPILARK